MHATHADLRHVFVYGTLRAGQANDINRLHPAPKRVGVARLAGTMYHLGTYPGVVLGGVGQVVGEVYQITPALEKTLDEIEEIYPQQRDEYIKQVVGVDVVPGGVGPTQRLPCLVYELNARYAAGKPTVAGGDWSSRAG